MSSEVAVGGAAVNGHGSATDDEEVHIMTEEELEKGKLRPPDIDQDMKEMDRRKRVEAIMNSVAFREELEKIVECQLSEGYSGVQTLQNISELIGIPAGRVNMFRSNHSVTPINDIRGLEGLNYAKGEKLLRCKLASIYRLVDMHGWSQNIYNHCTARVSQDHEHFLLNPFGLLYNEVTASTLVKVDMQGGVVDPGSTNYGVNVAGFLLHSAIHAARPDLRCIIHIHHPAVVAVSVLKQGLLPLSQESLVFGDVSYHQYHGLFVNPEEKEVLTRNLGPINKIMLLRNHGAVCCGETVEEAWYNTYHVVLACETQMKMAPLGLDNLILVTDEARQAVFDQVRLGYGGVDSKSEGGPTGQGTKSRKFKVGEMEFEALMRSLDNAGMRTGYIFRNPLVKQDTCRGGQSDVAVPPTASNYGQLYDEDGLRSPLRRLLDGKRVNDKSRWLNSPNVYQKVEILETGSTDPKKITKWVADGSPTHFNAIRIDDNLMFVPKDTDPKEFKKIQKAIKENRRIGNVTAGPTSHLLEGITWDEVRRMQDANISNATDHTVLVGAASKGIIQRDFQHNAVVYKTPYAKNPFDCVSDQELDDYKMLVERKQKGDPIEEIEVEKLHISPEVAQHDIVEDTRDGLASPLSPMSDDDAIRRGVVNGGRRTGQQLVFHTQLAPSPTTALPVMLSDDGISISSQSSLRGNKPPLPPKPQNLPPPSQYNKPPAASTSVPALNQSKPRPDVPQRVQATVKSGTLPAPRPCVSCPPGAQQQMQQQHPQTSSTAASSTVSLTSSYGGDTVANGDDTEAQHSALSHSSKEGSPTKDTSYTDDSMSKDKKKKKKKGLRTPSFLKIKKDKKKEKEAMHQ